VGAVLVCAAACGLLSSPPAGATTTWLAPATISELGENGAHPQVAVDPQQDAAAVWERYPPNLGANYLVRAALAPASAWLPALTLSEAGGDATAPQVTVDAQGQASAVWTRFNGTNYIAQVASTGAGFAWQPSTNLSEAGHEAHEPGVASDPQGDSVAIWRLGEGAEATVQAAFRPAGGTWQPAVNLSEPGVESGSPRVAIDAEGEAVAVWTRSNGPGEIIQSAWKARAGTWHAAVNLSEGAASSPQVTLNPSGRAIAVWVRAGTIQAAAGSAGGAWQAAINVSEPGQNARAPRVAVDAAGDAVVVWERPSGATEVIQTATMSAGGAWQAATTLSSAGAGEQAPALAMDPQGDAAAIWTAVSGLNNEIIQSAAKPAGQSWEAPANLSEPAGAGLNPQIAVGPFGHAVAIWVEDAPALLGAIQTTRGTIAPTPAVCSCAVHPTPAPVVSNLRESHRRWREGTSLASISRNRRHGHARKRAAPLGTTVTFSLNEPATVTFSFSRGRAGHRFGQLCVAGSRSHHEGRACTHSVVAGTVSFAGRAGLNRVSFEGRISHSKALAPGSYTLTVRATNATGASAARSLKFTIVRSPGKHR
jgi:hypothetical protein